MSRREKDALDRLGSAGLCRAMGDLLDHERLVRLANACGLEYPGMRTRSQASARILDDLVERAGNQAATRRAVYRALQKETRLDAREWSGLAEDEKRRRIEDDSFLRSNGQLGRHLFLLAASDAPEDSDRLLALLSIERELRERDDAEDPPPAARDVVRLNRRLTEQKKKVQRLETQLARSRETTKKIKKDLIQRKGEIAESRMLAERLRRDLATAEERLKKSAPPQDAPQPTKDVQQVVRSVRRLAADQRKLVHAVEKLPGSLSAPGPGPGSEPPDLAPIQSSIAEVRKEVAGLRKDRKKELDRQERRIDDLRAYIEDALPRGAAGVRATRSKRPATKEERVGVFIDVQNMYYAARQRKGKLDFDALLQAAVRERRMIQATAYVVESAEIDQSGFIAILQKRAIEVRRKTLQVRADGSTKGDWDMELALDILDAAPNLDVVVLVSGDGDFTSLVNRVKRMGPRVEVFGFPRNTAKSLLEAADEFQPLNRRFMIYPARRNNRPSPPTRRATPAGGKSGEPPAKG